MPQTREQQDGLELDWSPGDKQMTVPISKRKKQKRWSVSLRPLKGQRLRRLAARMAADGDIDSEALSACLERLIDEACEARGIPEETILEPRKVKTYRPGPAPHKACFSW